MQVCMKVMRGGAGKAALTSMLIKCNGLQRVGKRVRGHGINKWRAGGGDTIAS